MLLVLEIAMLIAGIAALIVGRVAFTRTFEVHGVFARIAGAILVLPVPIALIAALSTPRSRTQDQEKATQRSLTVMELVLTLGCLVSAVAVASVGSLPAMRKPRRRKRRAERRIEDDVLPSTRRYEDDAPRPDGRRPPDEFAAGTPRPGRHWDEPPRSGRQGELDEIAERGSNATPWIIAGSVGGGILLLTIIILIIALSGSRSDPTPIAGPNPPGGDGAPIRPRADGPAPPVGGGGIRPPGDGVVRPPVDPEPGPPFAAKGNLDVPADPPIAGVNEGKFTKPAKAAGPTSYLYAISTKGDFIGQGKTYAYRGDQLVVRRHQKRGVEIMVDGWHIWFGAPQGGFLQVGEYRRAKRFSFSDA